MEQIKELLNKVFGDSPTLNNLGGAISDVVSGKEKLTFSDMMNGGLLGKLCVNRKRPNRLSL